MGKPESQILRDAYRDVYTNLKERLNLLYDNNVPKHLLQVLERVQLEAEGTTSIIDPIQMRLDLLAIEFAELELGMIQVLEEKALQSEKSQTKAEEKNNPDRLKRKIDRTKMKITALKEKHGETPHISHNYFGGWDLGYLEGRLSILEDLYDETMNTEPTP